MKTDSPGWIVWQTEEDLLFWPREFQSAEREGAEDMLCFQGDWPAEPCAWSIAGEVTLVLVIVMEKDPINQEPNGWLWQYDDEGDHIIYCPI